MNFWDVVTEVTTRNVSNEANTRFYLGLAGSADAVRRAERAMFGYDATEAQIRSGRELLEIRTPPYTREDLDRLSLCHLVVILQDGPPLLQIRPAPGLMVSHPHDLVPALLQARPAWRIALARHFPAFREVVADRLIADVSRINAQFSLISAIPNALPGLPPWLLPGTVTADVYMLTKNQMLLVLRLAAIYGLDVQWKRRLTELVPTLGSGFGWRAMARQLVGLVPGGVGAAMKGTIAFTGTWVAGKAAQQYFRSGYQPTREQMRVLYEEAAERARLVVQHAVDRVRRLPEKADPVLEEPHKELPPHPEEGIEEEIPSPDRPPAHPHAPPRLRTSRRSGAPAHASRGSAAPGGGSRPLLLPRQAG